MHVCVCVMKNSNRLRWNSMFIAIDDCIYTCWKRLKNCWTDLFIYIFTKITALYQRVQIMVAILSAAITCVFACFNCKNAHCNFFFFLFSFWQNVKSSSPNLHMNITPHLIPSYMLIDFWPPTINNIGSPMEKGADVTCSQTDH